MPVCRSACLQVFGIAGFEFVCVFGHDAEGWNEKSNPSSVLTTGKREERMAACRRRLFRRVI